MATVLITGTNRGIGLELTRQYADSGARVFACCRAPEGADALQKIAAASGGRVTIHALDVTNGTSVAALKAQLDEEPIDVLINNAGIYGGEHQNAREMDYDAWARTFAVNTMSPLRLIQALRDNLIASKRPRAVTISSHMGSLTARTGGIYAYRTSKAAVNKLMQTLAIDLASDGVIVCVMHPGWVRTDMGGPDADLPAEESASGLRKVIEGLTQADSGRFLNWDGSPVPW